MRTSMLIRHSAEREPGVVLSPRATSPSRFASRTPLVRVDNKTIFICKKGLVYKVTSRKQEMYTIMIQSKLVFYAGTPIWKSWISTCGVPRPMTSTLSSQEYYSALNYAYGCLSYSAQ